MKASNSKSQTEYIELADVVGVYLDVRHSIHSAYSPLVPHGVIELRCVPWHLCCKLPISMLHVANGPTSTLHAAARCAPHRSRCCRGCQSKAAAIIIDYKLFDYTNSAKLGSLFRRESTSHTLKRRELKCTFTYGRCNGPHAARRAATLAPPPQPRACLRAAGGGRRRCGCGWPAPAGICRAA
jgi:hypothetical protein